jgi:hypothetical protein
METIMNFETPTLAILVITAGHVMVGRARGGNDGFVELYDARTIRKWGTAHGLNQLFDGPTADTVLDAKAPLILVPNIHIIFALPVNESAAWIKALA